MVTISLGSAASGSSKVSGGTNNARDTRTWVDVILARDCKEGREGMTFNSKHPRYRLTEVCSRHSTHRHTDTPPKEKVNKQPPLLGTGLSAIPCRNGGNWSILDPCQTVGRHSAQALPVLYSWPLILPTSSYLSHPQIVSPDAQGEHLISSLCGSNLLLLPLGKQDSPPAVPSQ